ncbi:hypothetical protein E2C01_007102 [Portunus trituberculatus]|uniref:Uncharacterized protein n=1 Tax=Portunus trituberculatus TaxID=210409 RepID=A0A5B7CYJ3_PORTR|nr:hypothetical protein [Portunus trituberculatus]
MLNKQDKQAEKKSKQKAGVSMTNMHHKPFPHSPHHSLFSLTPPTPLSSFPLAFPPHLKAGKQAKV